MSSYIKILLIALSCTVFLSSCEKVIDVKLDSAGKKYVIEATIADVAGRAKVLISQTQDFDQDYVFEGISGATVTITELGGSSYTLAETTAGIYEAPALTGTSGKTYQLSVTIGGTVFSASSSLPQKVNMDTVYITEESLFGDSRKTVNLEFDDPAGLGNNYRFIQYVNNLKQKQIFIQNDDYTDGNRVSNKLFYFPEDDDGPEVIRSGDQVKVELFNIDAPVYKYWFSLSRSAIGESGQATPANPVSNLQGGALGYFSAHTYQVKTITAP